MPLTRSRDHSPAPQITEEEQRLRDKRRRQFEMVLEDAADEKAAVLITVLKDLGEKKFKENQAAVQGYLIRSRRRPRRRLRLRQTMRFPFEIV
jgi:hypothetical protein